MLKDTGDEPLCNQSGNPTFASMLDNPLSRRHVLRGSLTTIMAGMVASSAMGLFTSPALAADKLSPPAKTPTPSGLNPILGFRPVPTSMSNSVTVPKGYSSQPFLSRGTPILAPYPAYLDDGSNSGADQEAQMGHQHDGMHYFPLDRAGNGSQHGLLCMNHENIEQQQNMHLNGPTIADGIRVHEDEVRKEVAAHGVSVVEIRKNGNDWEVVRGGYNRRITGATPMELSGPVRGSDMVRTRYSPDGTATRGTLNNCAHGHTPWTTYLTCEENWAGYFVNHGERPREQSRYGVRTTASRYAWETVTHVDVYARHDVTPTGNDATEDYRNEASTFGWVVEIDPMDPTSTPRKRTALGRFGHEGAWMAPARHGQPLTVYMGDDSRFEYIYKFVTKDRYHPRTAGGHMLDEGTLYVARFHADGSGEWLALDIDDRKFRAAAKKAGVTFKDQADVLINTRTAADIVGATPMDRPEWGAVHPQTGEVYMTLTNNSQRQPGDEDAANPRAPNFTGQIIRWREKGNQNWAKRFQWELFVIAGPEGDSAKLDGEPLDESNLFNSPDGLWFDQNGVLWIQTDGSQSAPYGNNMMLAADTRTGEIRRFMTGPRGCEVTGVVTTPDSANMFVNVQHPGGSWPDGGSAQPRSSTVIITRDDGGPIGI
ncbi:MAG: PhoX family phosphatase [Oleiphilaceae bacterium]|nr:PhoX family phosphatase [Oleiphilaceae bacterium]